MGVTWSDPRPEQAPQMGGRFWLTARAARALGHRVPSRIHDDEPVRLIPKETPK
jgi:hypothetical protein